jgi:hypothetical protein
MRETALHQLLPEVLRPTTTLNVRLPSGRVVALPQCRLNLKKWEGRFDGFTYGGKPIVSHDGKPVFAELALLQLLTADGTWDGAWVETYGGSNYLREMPGAWALRPWSIALPPEEEALLKRIWKAAKSQACFDVLGWHGEHVVFLEGKQKGKDRISKHQPKFIEAAIACGVPAEALIVVEWTWA